MEPAGTASVAITPQGVVAGEPAVLAALAARRGPAVLAFASEICEPAYVVRAAADAFARFRSQVADPSADTSVHPDALLLRCALRAALDLAPRGPDLGCPAATDLLAQRAERTLKPRDAALLDRHLAICEHCGDLSASLEAADRAYRDAEETALETSALAPMVAALAAAAPVHPTALPSAPPRPPTQSTPEEPAEVPPAAEEPEPAPAEEPAPDEHAPSLVAEEPEEAPEPALPEPEPLAPEPEALEPDPVPAAPDPEPAEAPEPREIPLGTRRVTGAPASYYELPEPAPREPRQRARLAAAAAGGAASLTRRAGQAARRRLERPAPAAPPEPAPPPDPDPEPDPQPIEDTTIWRPVDSIEFPAMAEASPTPLPEPAEQESAAKAAARHYRRLRHRRQELEQRPPGGRPPRLPRPNRDRGPHLPLSAHGPRDLALPAGLVVIAVLVIMAVSGVFGGGTETPTTGTAASAAPELALASQSATSISLTDAERVAQRAAGTTRP